MRASFDDNPGATACKSKNMTINVVHVCASSIENEASQVLATVLAVLFVIYTGITVLLAALQLYSVSNKPLMPSGSNTASVSATAGDVPLLSVAR